MRPRFSARNVLGFCLVGSVLSSLSCAAGDIPAPLTVPLTIVNESQFELQEVRVHWSSTPESASNLADGGLAVGQAITIPEFASGSFVTVVRQRVEVGERIAITTAEPVIVELPGSSLLVFDTSFRLLSPSGTSSAP